ncbi:MAG: hypothetical protein MR880_11515 [Negativibacillus massiliensis]|uniref:hypothetical protein n=1 Tax=Negativibacillus massiliensis TaxID=1871035 RepID=UPI0023F55382|nr:hypothetical protein [Negativibacillus massiliensis]MCI6348898.1 hypothetical protein [Negativibacillus massiliensis]MDY4048414.1 hypothetical protein [Negativibacillus massiliensis]
MEENRNTQNNTQTPEGNGGERLFTQDEVNRIISDRLSREREKPKDDERETEFKEREKALEAKENTLACREYISSLKIDEGHKSVFLDALDTNDSEKFKDSVNKLVTGLGLDKPQIKFYSPIPGCSNVHVSANNDIADAFKPKTKF